MRSDAARARENDARFVVLDRLLPSRGLCGIAVGAGPSGRGGVDGSAEEDAALLARVVRLVVADDLGLEGGDVAVELLELDGEDVGGPGIGAGGVEDGGGVGALGGGGGEGEGGARVG